MEINSSSRFFLLLLLAMMIFPFLPLSHSLIIVAFFFLPIVLKNASIHIDEGHWEREREGEKKEEEERGDFFLLLICYSFIVSFSSVSLYFGMHSNKCVSIQQF